MDSEIIYTVRLGGSANVFIGGMIGGLFPNRSERDGHRSTMPIFTLGPFVGGFVAKSSIGKSLDCIFILNRSILALESTS